MQNENPYASFLESRSAAQWRRIGTGRRAGVAVPLFCVYSEKSAGIGEIPDIKLLLDWCVRTSLSIVQLLPMNDVGFGFRPYDAQTSFALDPMYLSLDDLEPKDASLPLRGDVKKLKKTFPLAGRRRVDYRIKRAKLELLRKIFDADSLVRVNPFKDFADKNLFWLDDYCLFKVIKEKNNDMSWEGWSRDLKARDESVLASFRETYQEDILFHKWLQWQLFEQFKKVKKYAEEKGVLIMGDLPFLVARDSSDVWARQDYFKLHLSSGAPPDMLYSSGQRWGMPPYRWENMARNNYDYLVEKLKFAQNFYDLYRIDHAVGIFRVWTIALSEPLEHAGRNGAFDPQDETTWESHGSTILSVMTQSTTMLACAEDLGVIPACSSRTLEKFGIPGIDVQRWMRDWGKSCDFKKPGEYRENAVATVSTHDMSNLCAWWRYEAGCVDGELFERKCREKNIDFQQVREKLFDIQKSRHGRLRWKKEIRSSGVLLSVLAMPEDEARGLMDLYNGSFDEKEKFSAFLALKENPTDTPSPSFVKKTLEKINASISVFSIQLLYDWLSLDALFEEDPWDIRINVPGTLSDHNWSYLMPVSLEDILEMPVNSVMREIVEKSGRVA